VDEGHCTVQIPLDEFRAVRANNLAPVLDHRIARVMGSTSHVLRFVGGGELRYAYNSRGQVIELSSSGVPRVGLAGAGGGFQLAPTAGRVGMPGAGAMSFAGATAGTSPAAAASWPRPAA
jgi:hypothetical protein